MVQSSLSNVPDKPKVTNKFLKLKKNLFKLSRAGNFVKSGYTFMHFSNNILQ